MVSPVFFTVYAATTKAASASATLSTRSASPSPSASAVSSASTASLLKERIDKVIEQRKEQVKGVIDQLGSHKRGVVGEAQRITEKTVTIKNYNGAEILNFTSDVVITRDGKKATLKDIAVGDWVIGMGYGTNSNFRLLRVQVSSTSLQPKTLITTIATLQSLTTSQAVFIPRTSDGGTPATLIMGLSTKNTVYQDNEGNTIDRKMLKTDNQYVVAGFQDGENKSALIIRALAPLNPAESNAKSTPKP